MLALTMATSTRSMRAPGVPPGAMRRVKSEAPPPWPVDICTWAAWMERCMRFLDVSMMKCLTYIFGSHNYTTSQWLSRGRIGKMPLSSLLALYMGALVVILSACDASPGAPAALNKRTPTASTAAGEPILSHSQIFLHDAPLPTAADLRFDTRNWTLAGFDNAPTRFVSLPACCDAHPAPLWYQSLGAPVLESPVINNGLIYLVASDGYLHVLSAQNGAEQWRVPVGGELTADGLALSKGLIYLARDGHYIAALDATNGQERWRFDTVGVVRGTPLVVGHDLLVSSGANTLFCLDALTGEMRWRIAMGSSIEAAPLVVRTTTQTWLVIATQGGVCALLYARTGKQFASWKPGELRASPVVAQGILYQASLGDQGLFAFRL